MNTQPIVQTIWKAELLKQLERDGKVTLERRDAVDFINRMQALEDLYEAARVENGNVDVENNNLRRLAANALLMARHGDYSDCGEEWGRTAQCLANLDAEAAAMGLVIGGTFYDNDQRYGKSQVASERRG